MQTLDQLVKKAAESSHPTVAIAAANDKEVLKAVALSIDKTLANFILFDDEHALREQLENHFPQLLTHDCISIVHSPKKEQAAKDAVLAVSSHKAQVLMKGNLPTATILRAVLNKEYGLRAASVLSHVAAFEINGYDRLIFVTDAAMNIAPDLKEKAQIVTNAVQATRACGIEKPIVAPLAAVETINPAMQPTLDAASLVMMSERGQVKDCIIDGPLALDNAVSVGAAKQKGLPSDTAGNADILLVPNIESGNILYKSLIYFAKAKVGAIIQGAKAPIVLTSRADSAESKVYSLAFAILAAQK